MSRGMIKWQPFSAVVPGNVLVNDILKKKNIVTMPCLTDDKLMELEEKILISLDNQSPIKIKLFRNGRMFLKDGIVGNIDKLSKKITLNDGYSLFFSQIVEIY